MEPTAVSPHGTVSSKIVLPNLVCQLSIQASREDHPEKPEQRFVNTCWSECKLLYHGVVFAQNVCMHSGCELMHALMRSSIMPADQHGLKCSSIYA
eukprot:881091-Pelagomonas_calceolata.AAC.3